MLGDYKQGLSHLSRVESSLIGENKLNENQESTAQIELKLYHSEILVLEELNKESVHQLKKIMDNLFIQSPNLNKRIQVKVNCLLSYIFSKHHKYEVALKYGERALTSIKATKIKDPLQVALIHTILAYAYMNVSRNICYRDSRKGAC